MTIIKCKKDLYNGGKCFTKDREYTLVGNRPITTNRSLMDAKVLNDQREPHIIGCWWREFEIVE